MKLSAVFSVFFTLVCLGGCQCNDKAFDRLGQFTGLNQQQTQYQKSFYIPKFFRTSWLEATSACRSFNMELATLDTQAEYDFVKEQITKLAPLNWLHIGGLAKTGGSTTEWYWMHTNEKVNYTMMWFSSEPGFHRNQQWCLAIGSGERGGRFADIDCHNKGHHESEPFICQTYDHSED